MGQAIMAQHSKNLLKGRKLEPFGFEISSDLSKPLSTDEQHELQSLFFQNGLIVCHGLTLTVEDQVRVLSYIGPVLMIEDSIHNLSTDPKAGNAGTSEILWHAELGATDHPFKGLSLHAINVVDGKSSTKFANTVRAYSQMSDGMRAKIERLKVVMALGYDRGHRQDHDAIPDFVPRTVQPVVKRHTTTGAPYVVPSELNAVKIEDVPKDESVAIINKVFETLYAPDNVYEHVWNRGDLVIWDNQTLQHSRGNLSQAGIRTLQRVCLGEKGAEDIFPGGMAEYKAHLAKLYDYQKI